MLDKDKKVQTRNGFYWVYQDSIYKIVFFDYQKGYGREGPMEILENFKGHLQTDGYVGYDVFDNRPNITLIHCMAHARRMFDEALDNGYDCASYTFKKIQKLYTIERISKTDPILKSMWLWKQQQYQHVLPKSAIGKALAYSMERWHKLSVYTTDGRLNIDNNPVENSIRPVASELWRTNLLF